MEFLTRNTQGLLELKDVTAFETAAKDKDVVRCRKRAAKLAGPKSSACAVL